VDVVIMLVIISLALVIFALLFFASRLKGGDFDHGDRLSLLPLRDDDLTTDDPRDQETETTATAEEESPPHASHS